jgi:hypothetical protein
LIELLFLFSGQRPATFNAVCTLIDEVVKSEPDVRKTILDMMTDAQSEDETEGATLELLDKVLKFTPRKKGQLSATQLHGCLNSLMTSTAEAAVEQLVSNKVQATLRPLLVALQKHFDADSSATPVGVEHPYPHPTPMQHPEIISPRPVPGYPYGQGPHQYQYPKQHPTYASTYPRLLYPPSYQPLPSVLPPRHWDRHHAQDGVLAVLKGLFEAD